MCLEFTIDVSEHIGMHLKWNQSLIGSFSSVNTCHLPGPEMGWTGWANSLSWWSFHSSGVKAVIWGVTRDGLSEEMTIGLGFEVCSKLRREYFSLRNPEVHRGERRRPEWLKQSSQMTGLVGNQVGEKAKAGQWGTLKAVLRSWDLTSVTVARQGRIFSVGCRGEG